MITIISGTNRGNSNSIKIASLYKDMLNKAGGEEIHILDLRDIPTGFISNALYENIGKNEAFNAFIQPVIDADKLVFIVPEYNISIPGVLKAFIDALPYPSPLCNKVAALVGLGSGTLGGALALSHFSDILNYLGMHVLATKPRLPKIESLLKDGEMKDLFLVQLLESQAQQLLKF